MPEGHPSDVKHAPVGHPSLHRATNQPGGTYSHTGQLHTCTPMPHRPVTHMYTRVLMFYTDGPCNNSQQASRAALHQPPARPRRADVPGHAPITNYMCFPVGLPPLLTLPFWWQALHDGPFDALIFPSAPGTKYVLGSVRVQVLHVIGRPLLSPTLTFSPFLFGANFTLDALSVTQSTCTGAIAEIRASRPACRWSITETASAAALETTRDSNGQLSMVDEYIEQCIDRARTVHIEFLPTYLSTSLSAYLLTSCQPSLDNISAYLPACVPTHIPTYVHTHVLHQPA